MGRTCYLEFYVQKRPPDSGLVLDLVRLMQESGFSVIVDRYHLPVFGDWEVTREYTIAKDYYRHESMTLDEIVATLVKEEGGSIPFAEEPFPIRLSIFPLGGLGREDRAKALGESERGTVPLGSIRLDWDFLSTDVDNRERFLTTLDLGKSTYPILEPVCGFLYFDEIWDYGQYNLIPTERNILDHGPRDLFPLNFWSKDISERIEWRKIESFDDITIEPMEDSGLMIHLAVDSFVRYSFDGLREAERLLEWRK